MAKVFQVCEMRVVTSSRGPGGGFNWHGSGAYPHLIYEAIEGQTDGGYCLLHQKECPFRTCIFGDILKKMTKEIRDFLREKNLSELARGEVNEDNS